MKIIELAIKALNGEKLPKKFKYDGSVFAYHNETNDYRYEKGNISFFNDYCSPIYHFEDFLDTLNNELEIIEEEKPKEIEKVKEFNKNSTRRLNRLEHKINELIDKVNSISNKE